MKENVELIRLEREIKEKSTKLEVMQGKFHNLEQVWFVRFLNYNHIPFLLLFWAVFFDIYIGPMIHEKVCWRECLGSLWEGLQLSFVLLRLLEKLAPYCTTSVTTNHTILQRTLAFLIPYCPIPQSQPLLENCWFVSAILCETELNPAMSSDKVTRRGEAST